MRRRRYLPALILAVPLSLPLATACYTYTRVQTAAIQPGLSVRARVTPAAGERLTPLLGTAPRVLTGTLIATAQDTVIMEVPAVMQAEVGSSLQTLHQRVSVPRGDVIEWEIRTLNRVRTYALASGAAAIAAWLLVKALEGEPGSERSPGGGGADAIVPVFGRGR